jgi:hypothetical protein
MSMAPSTRTNSSTPNRLAIATVEFDVLWEWLGLGVTPVVLQVTSPGNTEGERRQIVNAAWQSLRQRGLADVNGPDPEIIRLMHLFAAPSEQVELRFWAARETRVLATRRDNSTALAVRQADTITLSRASSPNRGVLDAMPPALPCAGRSPGAGRSVTLPNDDLAAAYEGVADGCPVHEGLISRGIDAGDAELVEAIFGDVIARAQISMMVADNWGMLRRLSNFITVLDTRQATAPTGSRSPPPIHAAPCTGWTSC